MCVVSAGQAHKPYLEGNVGQCLVVNNFPTRPRTILPTQICPYMVKNPDTLTSEMSMAKGLIWTTEVWIWGGLIPAKNMCWSTFLTP